MEWIAEIIFEIIGAVIESEKVNRIIRTVFATLLFWLIIIVCIFAGRSALSENGIAGAVFCWVFAAAIFVFWIYCLIKINKKKKKD